MPIIKDVLSSVFDFEDILSFFLPAVSAAVYQETVPCLRSVSINYYLSHKNYNVLLFSRHIGLIWLKIGVKKDYRKRLIKNRMHADIESR